MRVTFFQSGKPQLISPPDTAGAADSDGGAPAWKQFDPLDPTFEQLQQRLLQHAAAAEGGDFDNIDFLTDSHSRLSMSTAATAATPAAYDRQMR